MSAARYNLIIDQGSDFALEFVVKESGSAKNLTGYAARAQIRPTAASSTLTATFTCTIETPTNGVVKAALASATTAALTPGRYVYDLEIHTTGGTEIVTRLLQGDVTVSAEVTR